MTSAASDAGAGGSCAGGGSFGGARGARLKVTPAPLCTSFAPSSDALAATEAVVPIADASSLGSGADPEPVAATNPPISPKDPWPNVPDATPAGSTPPPASCAGPSPHMTRLPPKLGPSAEEGGLAQASPAYPAFEPSGYASPPPPPPSASALLSSFSSPPRTDVAPWRLPDAYDSLGSEASLSLGSGQPTKTPGSTDLPKKKKNRVAQAERVRRELSLGSVKGSGLDQCATASVESCG